jgi:hypothetical protein
MYPATIRDVIRYDIINIKYETLIDYLKNKYIKIIDYKKKQTSKI